MASDKQNVRAACSKDKLFVIQNFFESCHKVGMFHKNDAVNQNVHGRQGIVLEIYGGAQVISLRSAVRYIIFYKSSFEDENN